MQLGWRTLFRECSSDAGEASSALSLSVSLIIFLPSTAWVANSADAELANHVTCNVIVAKNVLYIAPTSLRTGCNPQGALYGAAIVPRSGVLSQTASLYHRKAVETDLLTTCTST